MADVRVEPHGSIVLFQPLSEPAREWIGEHVSKDAMWFSGALVVEHHYASDLAQGMVDDGLVVE